jgi:hypothetical protein
MCHTNPQTTEAEDNRAADHAGLVALAERHRLDEYALDEHVIDAACNYGASVNNQGVSDQLEYLLDQIGAEATRHGIEAVARNRRRR